MYAIILVTIFLISLLYTYFRGKERLKLSRQLFDHSTFLGPINMFMTGFSRLPAQPFYAVEDFPELKPLQDNWQIIRDEAVALQNQIKAAQSNNDAGFNTFFKRGWKRFYLKWYQDSHPSAQQLCPKTVAILEKIPSVKAAMFAELPSGSYLGKHRDPYAGSLRYHLGLMTPNDERCFIDVDGQKYAWRDGQSVVFDETYIHYAENATDQNRIIFFADVERPLKSRLMEKFNHWFGKNVMTAASSPNDASDRTGGLNKAFCYVYQIRLKAKALKKSNRQLYYVLKWVLMLGIFFLIFIRPYVFK